jgi:hypothetical protein
LIWQAVGLPTVRAPYLLRNQQADVDFNAAITSAKPSFLAANFKNINPINHLEGIPPAPSNRLCRNRCLARNLQTVMHLPPTVLQTAAHKHRKDYGN